MTKMAANRSLSCSQRLSFAKVLELCSLLLELKSSWNRSIPCVHVFIDHLQSPHGLLISEQLEDKVVERTTSTTTVII